MKQGKQIHIRLPEVVYRKLKMESATKGRSVQDCVSELIWEGLMGEQHGQAEKGDKEWKSVLRLLQECSVFDDADAADLERLANNAETQHFDKGKMIYNEEESPDAFLIVAHGMVKIFKTSMSGREFIIDMRRRGEMIGKMPVTDKVLHCASAQAVEDTDIVYISKKQFMTFTSRNPAVMTKVAGLEMIKVSSLYSKLIDLVSDRTDQRVNKVIYAMADKYGSVLSFTHNEIAKMSGTTNETATRILTGLKNRGIVKLSRGKLVVVDKEKLLIRDKSKA